jgi:hypothetical protein
VSAQALAERDAGVSEVAIGGAHRVAARLGELAWPEQRPGVLQRRPARTDVSEASQARLLGCVRQVGETGQNRGGAPVLTTSQRRSVFVGPDGHLIRRDSMAGRGPARTVGGRRVTCCPGIGGASRLARLLAGLIRVRCGRGRASRPEGVLGRAGPAPDRSRGPRPALLADAVTRSPGVGLSGRPALGNQFDVQRHESRLRPGDGVSSGARCAR